MDHEYESTHLYRFGFLASTNPHRFQVPPNDCWRRDLIGGLALLVHKETEVRHVESPLRSVIVLGPIFAIGEQDIDVALERLINASDLDLSDQLNELSGRFCLILRTLASVRVFSDPIGSRSIFYSLSDPTSIASHVELLANQLGLNRASEMDAFIKTEKYRGLSVKYLPGDLTMYEDIVALLPNHSLTLGSGKTERFWPVRACQESRIDELLARCEVYFKGLARGLTDRQPFIGVTGGIDTRLLFAGLSRSDLNIRGMTWLGGYHDERERPIIETIVRRMRLENTYVDVPGPANEVASAAGRNGGGARGDSRLTSAISSRFAQVERAVFLRGYGGEVIRGFYNIQKEPLQDGSLAELVRIYAHKSKVKDPSSLFDRVSRQAFQSFTERAKGYDGKLQELGYDVADIFYWEQRMGNWGATMHNEMDAAMLSMTGLNDRIMYNLAYGIPRQKRLTKHLFQKLIAAMEPRLAGLPFG